jgi:CBS domain-containing protein
MRVGALVGDEVIFVAPEANLLEVADALTRNGIGALAIGDGDRPVGIVSERDVVHALAGGRSIEATRAADIANTTLVWCDASASTREVASEMMERYVRHVLVESDGRLVGIVSARDLLGFYASGGSGNPARI